MRIWLIRHFQTQGNLERRYIGRTDEPILPGQTGTVLCDPKKIVASPMLRCRQTAEQLFQRARMCSGKTSGRWILDDLKEKTTKN